MIDRVQSSGSKTESSIIVSGRNVFSQVVIQPDGSNDITLTVYDGIDSTGNKLLPTFTFLGDGGPKATPPISCIVETGIYIDVSVDGGGSCEYTVLYRSRA